MSDITGSGYPFFAGKMTFDIKAIASKIADVKLKFKGRFHTAHIKWNEYEADVILQNYLVIPKKYVKCENDITLTLYNAGRNIFGPFHYADISEPKNVYPKIFTLKDTWEKDHTSKHYRDSFSLVPFGVKLESTKFNFGSIDFGESI